MIADPYVRRSPCVCLLMVTLLE